MLEALIALCFVVVALGFIVHRQYIAICRINEREFETASQIREILTLMSKHYDIIDGLFEAAKNTTLTIEHILRWEEQR